MRRIGLVAACCLLPLPADAATLDFCVRLQALATDTPPLIGLSWAYDFNAAQYAVNYRSNAGGAWQQLAVLPGSATSFVHTNVQTGAVYEYWVNKAGDTVFGDGYTASAIASPLNENRGRVVLLADISMSEGLDLELTRLGTDLVGDGWTVVMRKVPRMLADPASTDPGVHATRSNEVYWVKSLIKGEFLLDPLLTRSVILLGRVPVPYSGVLAPDDHSNHMGAWPADVYYADVGGDWADSVASASFAADRRNWNVPGDGKFDTSSLIRDVVLEVGRIDFSNLPAFSFNEEQLLRRYLAREHSFRFGAIEVKSRALVDDHLGISTGEPLAANGWRNFAPLVGITNTFSGDWSTSLQNDSYLWTYGCGGGSFTSINGVASTATLAELNPKGVFHMFFGSYFGDWDSRNNVMRSVLAADGYALTAVWAGRPFWQFHHMSLGETIGYCARVTQNNRFTYDANVSARGVHIALMGDPTLRMHPVGPPAGLNVVTNGVGGVQLTWEPSTDSILGYYVYRATNAVGPFTRVTTNLVTGTEYTDPEVTTDVYMVRAVKLEVSASGSYYNASQGIFQSLDGSAGAPWVELYEPTNNAVYGQNPTIQVSASLFDPANSVTNVAFYADGTKIGESAGWNYTFTWTNAPGGTHVLMARAWSSIGRHTNSQPVTVRVDHGGKPRLGIANIGSGSNVIGGEDLSNRVYRIQFADGLSATEWQVLGWATSGPPGRFQFVDTNTGPERVYRSVFP